MRTYFIHISGLPHVTDMFNYVRRMGVTVTYCGYTVSAVKLYKFAIELRDDEDFIALRLAIPFTLINSCNV